MRALASKSPHSVAAQGISAAVAVVVAGGIAAGQFALYAYAQGRHEGAVPPRPCPLRRKTRVSAVADADAARGRTGQRKQAGAGDHMLRLRIGTGDGGVGVDCV